MWALFCRAYADCETMTTTKTAKTVSQAKPCETVF